MLEITRLRTKLPSRSLAYFVGVCVAYLKNDWKKYFSKRTKIRHVFVALFRILANALTHIRDNSLLLIRGW